MMPFIGELAALAAAFGFAMTSVCYTFSGRKIDAVTAMAMSLPIAWVVISVTHRITLGAFFPFGVSLERWGLLGASGILSFAIASYFIFNAFQYMGPRLTMLVLSFAPVLSAILAWILLGQTLPANATLGIAVVIFGIVWVVAERGETQTQALDLRKGVLFASLGTLAQSASFVFSSQGVSGDFPPFSATLIRITIGVIALWLLIAWQRRLRATANIFDGDLRLFLQLSGAALSGPVIGGSLLLLSFQHVPVGISTTLSHTTSIILIPVGYYVFKERITMQAVTGTLVTVVGIGILFA